MLPVPVLQSTVLMLDRDGQDQPERLVHRMGQALD